MPVSCRFPSARSPARPCLPAPAESRRLAPESGSRILQTRAAPLCNWKSVILKNSAWFCLVFSAGICRLRAHTDLYFLQAPRPDFVGTLCVNAEPTPCAGSRLALPVLVLITLKTYGGDQRRGFLNSSRPYQSNHTKQPMN